MSRLTTSENGTGYCNAPYCQEDCNTCIFFMAIRDKLAHYEDLDEDGRLIDSDRQVDEGYLYDWYIHSVCDIDTPVWTEGHIKELTSDFILIPRAKLVELKEGAE